jgi:hypothetical protein
MTVDIYDKDALKKLVITLMDKFPGRQIFFNDSVGYAHASPVQYAITIHLKYREYYDNEQYISRLLSIYKQTQYGHTFKSDDLYVVGIEQDPGTTVPADTIRYIDTYIGNHLRKSGVCPHE